MAQYIMQILHAQLMIVWSWGFNGASMIENGLSFKVEGFKFRGKVEVRYNEGTDLFDIRLVKNTKTVEEITDVYADQLVNVIDNHVEKVEDYENKVKEEYSLIG